MSGERAPDEGPGDANRAAHESTGEPGEDMAIRIAKLLTAVRLSNATPEKDRVGGETGDPASALPAWLVEMGVSLEEFEEWRVQAAADWETPQSQAWTAEVKKQIAEGTYKPTDFGALDRLIKSYY